MIAFGMLIAVLSKKGK
ncbi:hypothetical protein [Bacillus paralicheniformis]|nr:hypothetical protein [Bacillus paralicheniformis]UZN56857.1 hypothetical protein OPU65_04760 [Bacillus paralicheniformis]